MTASFTTRLPWQAAPAGRLWDGLTMVAATDGFFELKRTQTRKASFE